MEIYLAGGCFWGVEEYYKRLKGINKTKVGYMFGDIAPTYEKVCDGSGHAEVVYLSFDENIISFNKVLEHFFRIVDPTSFNRQAGDIGVQYRSGIYYLNSEEELIKKYIKEEQQKYRKEIVVEVKKASVFYDAEEYHQDYLTKNQNGYCHVDFSKIKDSEKK